MVIMRKLYHGSEKIIQKPIYGQGKKYNDYGLGFYCTDSIDMAKEWGVKRIQTDMQTAMNWIVTVLPS